VTTRERRRGNTTATAPKPCPRAETDSSALSVPDIDPGADNLTAALAWAKAGWYVLPVKRGTKDPGSIVGRRWQHKSSRDPKVIAAWFAGTDHDIAVHCGRSGAVVLDVDKPELVPADWWQHLNTAPYQSSRPDTPDRGHYIFAMPEGRSIGNPAFPWGEVRGLNGVIIVANSFHKDGGEYRLQRTGSLPVLPDDIADKLDDASPATDAATDAAVRRFLDEHKSQTRPTILAGWTSALTTKFDACESRHMSTVSVLTGAMKEARAGYYPAQAAVDTLRPMFLAAVAKPPTSSKQNAPRAGSVAEAEFAGILAWAIGQALDADLDEIRHRVNEKMPDDDDADEVKHSGHLGMAVKLGKRFQGKLLYVNGIGWHRWDGKRYARDDTGAARRAVHAVIRRDRRIVKQLDLPAEEQEKRFKEIARYESASAITGILTEAAALSVFSVRVNDVDADPWLFNCANGTLDLRTMQLRDHDPADRITKIANAAYDPDVTGAGWTDFLETVLPDEEVRGFLQRLTGLGLLGEVNGDKQILPIATGEGANGKSTFTEAAVFALGDYAMAAEPTLLMAKRFDAHPTGIADLLGKRFVTTIETEQGRGFDIAALKWLTGGDTIKARFMRQDFFSFAPSHLLLLATNHLPRIDDDTVAVWRRIRVIPFTVEIPEDDRDENLKDKLRVEADAVLTWIVAGWKDYRRRGGLDAPKAVKVATNAYKAESDAVGRFIEEECKTGSPAFASKTKDLYARWEQWARSDGCLPISQIAFGRALDARGYPADQRAYGRPRRGITLTTEPFAESDSWHTGF
jgi:putative DNA primase/helicase